jgi:hypothetical protein
MRFRQQRTDGMVHLDIADLTAVKEWVEFGPGHERLTSRAYRERVEACVLALVAENPVLQKLRDGSPVTEAEIATLATSWPPAHRDRDLCGRSTTAEAASPSSCGTSRSALVPGRSVTGAFDASSPSSDLTTLQIRFLRLSGPSSSRLAAAARSHQAVHQDPRTGSRVFDPKSKCCLYGPPRRLGTNTNADQLNG